MKRKKPRVRTKTSGGGGVETGVDQANQDQSQMVISHKIKGVRFLQERGRLVKKKKKNRRGKFQEDQKKGPPRNDKGRINLEKK